VPRRPFVACRSTYRTSSYVCCGINLFCSLGYYMVRHMSSFCLWLLALISADAVSYGGILEVTCPRRITAGLACAIFHPLRCCEPADAMMFMLTWTGVFAF